MQQNMVSTLYYCAVLAILASSSTALEAKDNLALLEEPEKTREAQTSNDFVHTTPLRCRGDIGCLHPRNSLHVGGSGRCCDVLKAVGS
jgi:hypothetical protein